MREVEQEFRLPRALSRLDLDLALVEEAQEHWLVRENPVVLHHGVYHAREQHRKQRQREC
jgi:hypothetical protein